MAGPLVFGGEKRALGNFYNARHHSISHFSTARKINSENLAEHPLQTC